MTMDINNLIENGKTYKNIMDQIEEQWSSYKEIVEEAEDGEEELETFKQNYANIENLMLHQKWCDMKMNEMNEDYGIENKPKLYDMVELKRQVLYWVMSDFQGE